MMGSLQNNLGYFRNKKGITFPVYFLIVESLARKAHITVFNESYIGLDARWCLRSIVLQSRFLIGVGICLISILLLNQNYYLYIKRSRIKATPSILEEGVVFELFILFHYGIVRL